MGKRLEGTQPSKAPAKQLDEAAAAYMGSRTITMASQTQHPTSQKAEVNRGRFAELIESVTNAAKSAEVKQEDLISGFGRRFVETSTLSTATRSPTIVLPPAITQEEYQKVPSISHQEKESSGSEDAELQTAYLEDVESQALTFKNWIAYSLDKNSEVFGLHFEKVLYSNDACELTMSHYWLLPFNEYFSVGFSKDESSKLVFVSPIEEGETDRDSQGFLLTKIACIRNHGFHIEIEGPDLETLSKINEQINWKDFNAIEIFKSLEGVLGGKIRKKYETMNFLRHKIGKILNSCIDMSHTDYYFKAEEDTFCLANRTFRSFEYADVKEVNKIANAISKACKDVEKWSKSDELLGTINKLNTPKDILSLA